MEPATGRGRRVHEWALSLPAAVLAIGFIAIAAVQHVAPVANRPLYDGVVVEEPYRWLDPPAGAPGDPQSASGTAPVESGSSPLIALATSEQPPQAQIFAGPGSLNLPAGATSVTFSITPVRPEAAPSVGYLAGNVYRISVTDQDGVALTAPASAQVSIAIRGPADATNATIERYVGGAWVPLASEPTGFTSSYLAVVTEFGDFALVVPGSAPTGSAPAGSAPAGSAPAGSAPAPSESPGSEPAQSGSTPSYLVPALIGTGVVILVIGAAIVAIAQQRPPPAPPSRRSGGQPGTSGPPLGRHIGPAGRPAQRPQGPQATPRRKGGGSGEGSP
jgi:hypothetical protein